MQATKTSFNKWALYLGILPAVLFYVVMNLGPSIATFVLSFTDITGTPGVPWKFIGIANYKEFFFIQNPRDTMMVLKNTVIFCLLVTFVQNAIALPIAVVLNNKFIKGRNFYRAVVFLPVVLGVMVTSLTWLLMFNPTDGPVSQLIGIFGLSSNFFADKETALYYVIFCQIWMAMGYSMVINLAGLQGIPTELYEAGEIDGTTGNQAFRYITFPMLWPTIAVNITLALIGSLSSFQIILFTASGGLNIFTQTMAMRVMYFAFNLNAGMNTFSMRQGFGAAVAMMLFVFILIVTLVSHYVTNRREMEA
ncbi:MAG: sugar ABC transporter permease [Clostridia bacterium]|nr:sugar ABC transporter permease [Clostridia bacterium]